MMWVVIIGLFVSLVAGPSVSRKSKAGYRRAKRKAAANNPLSESYWKRKIPPNQRLPNLGAALATPQTKTSNRNAAINKKNKQVINNHKREKEQAEHDRQKTEQEAEKLRGKLHEASVLFEQIQSLATTYPNHWVQRVRTNAGKGVSVCHV